MALHSQFNDHTLNTISLHSWIEEGLMFVGLITTLAGPGATLQPIC